MSFDKPTRNALAKMVGDCRRSLTTDIRDQLQRLYGLQPDGSALSIGSLRHLDERGHQIALELRAWQEHLAATEPGAEAKKRATAFERLTHETAFTLLNRLSALRMCEERGHVIECVRRGMESDGFVLYERFSGGALGTRGETYRMFLRCIFDELAVDLGALFDSHAPQSLVFPQERCLEHVLASLNNETLAHLWKQDETIGWIYQYFNSKEERKAMREVSTPRNSRELAVRNQFFTPRYVVEFLTDNTLGRIWYEMRKGQTAITEKCRYLVRRPKEIFLSEGKQPPEPTDLQQELSSGRPSNSPTYIPFRLKTDPRDIRVLDPACGSGHFLMYAFDLLETIYEEEWSAEGQAPSLVTGRCLREDFSDIATLRKSIPGLILRHNLYGIDIDSRAGQVAAMALWLRAQQTFQRLGIKAEDRPKITRSNITCAEPMPGEREMLDEFLRDLRPNLLGQLVRLICSKMTLAGEAGPLLRIEEEIRHAIADAKSQWLTASKQEQLSLWPEGRRRTIEQMPLFDLSGITDEEFWQDAEHKVFETLRAYAETTTNGEGFTRRLFAEDAERGFAFIDLCRARYDVILMNPPFGEGTARVKDYLKDVFGFGRPDLYMCFFFRMLGLLSVEGKVGAISSRTFHTLEFYLPMRVSILGGGASLDVLADFGSGVLDDATVETSAYVARAFQKPDHTLNGTIFIDMESCGDRPTELVDQIRHLCAGETSSRLYSRHIDWLAKLPGGVLAYWLPNDLAQTFRRYPPIDPDFCVPPLIPAIRLPGPVSKVRQGLIPGDLNRFCRLRWEVPKALIGKSHTWCPMMKGGDFSRFYAEDPWLVLWKDNGKEIRSFAEAHYGGASRTIKNDKEFFRSGLTYPRVSSVGINVRKMPEGCIFSDTGMAVLPENSSDTPLLLGLLNTRLVDVLCKALHPGRKFEIAHLATLPFAQPELRDRKVGVIAEEIYDRMQTIIALNELDTEPTKKIKFDRTLGTFNEWVNWFQREFVGSWCELATLQKKLDDAVFEAYDISPESRELTYARVSAKRKPQQMSPEIDVMLSPETISSHDLEMLAPSAQEIAEKFLCECIRNTFLHGKKRPLEDEDPGSAGSPDLSMFVDDSGHESDIITAIEREVTLSVGDRSPTILEEIGNVLGLRNGDIRPWVRDSFFGRHLREYSRSPRSAPIFWPLSTATGAYTVWIYYRDWREDSTHAILNSFVKPKISEVERQLRQIESKVLGAVGRDASKLREELEGCKEFLSELMGFRDELLRIAALSYKPNLNDGVLITACPLWKLFRLPKWRNDLEECWRSLEAGEYDWAHLAYSIWPDRVREACEKDRSIAIAHGLEELCEVVPLPAKHKRSTKKKAEHFALESEE